MYAGKAKMRIMRLGLMRKSVFGRNSPVTSTMRVARIVCRNSHKASFGQSPSGWWIFRGMRIRALTIFAIRMP